MQHNLRKHFYASLQLKPSLGLGDKNTNVLFPAMNLVFLSVISGAHSNNILIAQVEFNTSTMSAAYETTISR